MLAKIVEVKKETSCADVGFYWVFFKGSDGKSARTCVVPTFKNYTRWKSIISRHFAGEELWLDNLNWARERDRLIDADSLFTVKHVAQCKHDWVGMEKVQIFDKEQCCVCGALRNKSPWKEVV